MRTIAQTLLLVLTALLALGCGVEGQETEGGDHTVFKELRPDLVRSREPKPVSIRPDAWSWPSGERSHAFVEVEKFGAIEIELYPELAPNTVANFEKLAASRFYDGTSFHRVIPGFMVQGGDPNTRDDDPSNDGKGGPGYTIPDEFSEAPHLRGTVAMANRSRPDTSGAQFFIVHADSQHLDHSYNLFGRVVSGMDVVDQIAAAERDAAGRWGPKDRPIEPIVMRRVWVASPRTLAALKQYETDDEAPAPPAAATVSED